MSDDQPAPAEPNLEAVFSHYRQVSLWNLPGSPFRFLRPLGLAGTAVSQSYGYGTMTVTPSPDAAEVAAQVEPPVVLSGNSFPELLLGSEIVVLGDKAAEGFLIERVGISFGAVFKQLISDPNFLLRFNPRQLEEIIAAAYDREGCEVVLTPRSADGGRDVIATYKGFGTIRILDQVKRYDPKNRVPADDVRALFGVLCRDPAASKGVVTTTSSFAPGVATEFATAMPSRLELREGNDIKQWIERLAKKES